MKSLPPSCNAHSAKQPRRTRTIPVSVTMSLIILGGIVLAALFAPFITSVSPTAAALRESMLPPGSSIDGGQIYLFGTDLFGRDVFSRVIYGAQISLSVAAIVIVVGGIVGTILGIIAGYVGGIFDAVIMRIADLMFSLPAILMAIAVAVVFGPSFQNLVIVISVLIWPTFARQVRGEAMAIARSDYVAYSVSAGISSWRIMIRHILPNVLPTLLVLTTFEIGRVILLEATLSFLGAGIPDPAPSWGRMVSDGRTMLQKAWWVSFFPGLSIMLTVMACNLIGDWLRDHLDPRLRER